VAVGCSECHFTGYKGRRAVYEVVQLDAELADLLRSGVHDATDALQARGIRTLASSATELLRAQLTSLDEVHSLLSAF
jgi:general secretion pathway protein E/type IV pilus assembly protein PilB